MGPQPLDHPECTLACRGSEFETLADEFMEILKASSQMIFAGRGFSRDIQGLKKRGL